MIENKALGFFKDIFAYAFVTDIFAYAFVTRDCGGVVEGFHTSIPSITYIQP